MSLTTKITRTQDSIMIYLKRREIFDHFSNADHHARLRKRWSRLQSSSTPQVTDTQEVHFIEYCLLFHSLIIVKEFRRTFACLPLHDF